MCTPLATLLSFKLERQTPVRKLHTLRALPRLGRVQDRAMKTSSQPQGGDIGGRTLLLRMRAVSDLAFSKKSALPRPHPNVLVQRVCLLR